MSVREAVSPTLTEGCSVLSRPFGICPVRATTHDAWADVISKVMDRSTSAAFTCVAITCSRCVAGNRTEPAEPDGSGPRSLSRSWPMWKLESYGIATALIVLGGCAENRGIVDPADDRDRWNWDSPLATIGGGGPAVLICSPLTVAFNGVVSCVLANVGPMNVPTWRFEGFGGLLKPGPLGLGAWSGPLVVSGDIVVQYADEYGLPASQRQTIGVTRRNWSWAPLVGGRSGTLGEIDVCFDPSPNEVGLTGARDCTLSTREDFFTPRVVSNGNGYTATQVSGTGPNGGFWYLSNPTGTMDLRAQVRRDHRTDGTAYSVASPPAVANGCASAFPQAPATPRSMHTVNTACIPTTAFTNYVNCIWTHETAHITAGRIAAQASANDVYRLWEPLVRISAADLQTAASVEYAAAEGRVSTPLIAAHDPPLMQGHSFSVWYNAGLGWGTSPTIRSLYC